MTNDSDDKKDKVGYKKPPKHSQFPKGKSGNPKGRPPKEKKIFHLALIDIMGEEITLKVGGEDVTMTLQEALIKKMMLDSMNGKQTATKNFIEIMKHLQNMPPI